MHTASDKLETPKRPFPYSHSRAHSHTATHPLTPVDLKLPSAASKGKQRETEGFHFGWWDFVPLLESRRPPLQWTSSSLIITAHATQPRVACLHFPSNKNFSLPSPPPLAASSASYEPPSIISVSSRDDWIFAYFPGNEVDGVGCFWHRSPLVDDWIVKEWRPFARGNGVVAACWLNPDREWTTLDSGTPVRLPALGPFIPLVDPVLLLVTEAHMCNVLYMHPRTEQVYALSASLSRRSSSKEGQERSVGESVDGPRGLGRCVHAAIGLGYDETSVLVSTYSSFVPSARTETVSQQSTDINLSLSMPVVEEPGVIPNWETWRDENVIENCEVNIFVEGTHLRLATTPLPCIRDFIQSGRCLTSLTFAPALPSNNQTALIPSTPTQTHRRITPQSSPATLHAHVMQSPGRTVLRSPAKGTPPKTALEKAKSRPLDVLYLLCTTVDSGQYTSCPCSDVSSYVFFRNPVDPQTWYFRRASQLALPDCVVVHLSPSLSSNTTPHTSALLGFLNHEGQAMKHKSGQQQLYVGKLQILRLPELQIDDGWEPVNISCPVGSSGAELPSSLAVSPNRALVCGVSSTSFFAFSLKEETGIYQHPTKVLHVGQDSAQKATKQLAGLAEAALQRHVTPSDIVYCLCNQIIPISNIEEAFAAALSDFEMNDHGLSTIRVNEVIGIAVEFYRQRSLIAKSDCENFTARYRTGIEICSLSACNIVWEDTFDGRGYDPDAVWHLISLCGYFMEEFLETLLKECVNFASEKGFPYLSDGFGDSARPVSSPHPGENSGFSPASQARPVNLDSSQLHLVHPYALDILHSFVQHVRRFRGFLGTHMRADDRYEVAREILIDTIDSSPINLEVLDRVLSEIKADVRGNAEQSPELTRRSLVALKPSPEHMSLLRKIVSKLMQAEAVDKVRLFIKPGDLVDSMIGLSVSSSGKVHERDVITKGYLSGQRKQMSCLRCGGSSEIGTRPNAGHSSIRWTVWERTWQTHCICGGLWSTKIQ